MFELILSAKTCWNYLYEDWSIRWYFSDNKNKKWFEYRHVQADNAESLCRTCLSQINNVSDKIKISEIYNIN